MVKYLGEMNITCSQCRRMRKTSNPHTKETGICLTCRKRMDENDRLEFTCDYCHRIKLASTRERMLSGTCSECVLICSNCKSSLNRGLMLTRSTAEIEHQPAIPTPDQEHRNSCGRRYCDTCRDYCWGTEAMFNEHLAEHRQEQQAQILQPPRRN